MEAARPLTGRKKVAEEIELQAGTSRDFDQGATRFQLNASKQVSSKGLDIE
jgi:hypothetical protein